MPRLFLAIDLPDEIKASLTGFTRELPSAKWVGPEELHLTLRFIGEVDEKTCSLIKGALSKLSFEAFPLTLCGVGHFPPGKHPRVLWVGMDPSNSLMRLQQELELALIDAGIAPDERRFSPHITLARLKESAPGMVLRFETAHADLACAPFQVREFILFSSILTHQGAIHNKEAIYPCQGSPVSPRRTN
jgi:RNA 2',3'-cyclic 3'-phosphodiesterase